MFSIWVYRATITLQKLELFTQMLEKRFKNFKNQRLGSLGKIMKLLEMKKQKKNSCRL